MFYGKNFEKWNKNLSVNKNLSYWRETENSLSSNLFQKMKDGYSVYDTI